jgi:hypothetical protein
MRNFTILLLSLALLAAGFEGYRERARTRTSAPTTNSAATNGEDGSVHAQEGGCGLGPIK